MSEDQKKAVEAFRFDVPIDLDRARVFKFDLDACAEFEREMGYSIPEVFTKMLGGKPLWYGDIRALVWCALLHDPSGKCRISEVSKLIDQAPGESPSERIDHVTEKVVDAWVRFKGPEAKKKWDAMTEKLKSSFSALKSSFSASIGPTSKELLTGSLASSQESSGD